VYKTFFLSCPQLVKNLHRFAFVFGVFSFLCAYVITARRARHVGQFFCVGARAVSPPPTFFFKPHTTKNYIAEKMTEQQQAQQTQQPQQSQRPLESLQTMDPPLPPGIELRSLVQYWPTGQVMVQGKKDAKDHLYGWLEEFDPDGNLVKKSKYHHGFLHGELIHYYPDGTVKLSAMYHNGRPSKECRRYLADGTLMEVIRFDANGQIHGARESYHQDGSLKAIDNYKHGLMDGQCWEYYPAGNSADKGAKGADVAPANQKPLDQENMHTSANSRVRSRSTYFRGRMIGVYERCSEEGNILERAHFDRQGKQCGVHTFWRENGTMESQVQYKEGKLHGKMTVYYDDGKTRRMTGRYKNGKKSGRWRQFNADGSYKIIVEYNDCGQKHGSLKAWYAKNKPSELGRYVEDKKTGTWYRFHEGGGNLSSMEHYDKGELHGWCQYWAKDGTPQRLQHYSRGKLDGSQLIWHSNGHLSSMAQYRNSRLHGERLELRRTGVLQFICGFKDHHPEFTWVRDENCLFHLRFHVPSSSPSSLTSFANETVPEKDTTPTDSVCDDISNVPRTTATKRKACDISKDTNLRPQPSVEPCDAAESQCQETGSATDRPKKKKQCRTKASIRRAQGGTMQSVGK
jgi:antitoxin component YwqK of YwqJK toxin-antitoxin module